MKRKELAGVGLKRINMQTITPLTKAEKRRIYEACECVQLYLVPIEYAIDDENLCNEFFCFSEYDLHNAGFLSVSELINLRIILLLLFAHAGKIEGTVEE